MVNGAGVALKKEHTCGADGENVVPPLLWEELAISQHRFDEPRDLRPGEACKKKLVYTSWSVPLVLSLFTQARLYFYLLLLYRTSNKT